MSRENGFSPVKSYFMTPTQLAEHDQLKRGLQVKKWERTMTKEQYMQAVAEGRSRADIVLKHFNNDPKELRNQLNDWETTEKEAMELAKEAKPTVITKEQYLQRRLNGEGRTRIINSLGIGKATAYELLKGWGIREIDAEERELELLAPKSVGTKVPERLSDQIEQRVEARADLQQENHQWSSEVVKELEHTEVGEDILKRMEQRAASQEQELANLQAASELWKNDAERKGEHIADLEAEISRLSQLTTNQSFEITSLEDSLSSVNNNQEMLESTFEYVKTLESEREVLLKTIEQAANRVAGMITFQIPILPVQIAVLERTRIYDTLEALGHGIEGAEIDRQRVAMELFELLQRVVNFITADLIELHPGQDATAFIHHFFNFYNNQHIQSVSEELTDIRKVG